jgi:iron complex outermembrane receptor protein
MRIRGADNTRINVTMNGIPVNDSESHGVWWVNMPDLASSIEDIQIQRGVGSSTNGAGAFGATINLRTNQLNSQAYAEANTSFGSFNTQKYNLKAGSGLIADRFTIDARGSIIKTDGYIDRAKADLKSIFLTSSYYGDNNSIIFNYINGKENTYQAWNGVPLSYLDDDEKRTFNSYTYENEVDDYNQVHYQLFYNHQLGNNFKMELASFLVRGQGFYEQYKEGEDLDDYGLKLKDVDGNDLISSDLIRQKWLDNYFYGAVYNFTYSHQNGDFILGGGWNKYDGDHFGKVLKVIDASPSTLNPKHEYYRNNAQKEDFNIYLKMDQMIGNYVNLYADVQYRNIDYNFEGLDEFGNPAPGSDSHNFFLPKAGLSFLPNDANTIYFSYARGAREPNRTDYVDNPVNKEPKAEYLNDFEGGYKLQTGDLALEVNLFYMHYQDQLIATGKLNDVGNAIRVNVDDSYRAGVEFAFAWRINEYVKWDGNLAYSKSNISNYTEYFDDWDNWTQIAVDYQNTAMAFSPEIISASNITVTPFDNFNVGLISKYVGEQYIDNTQSNLRKLDDYFLNNIKMQYDFSFGPFEKVTLSALVNNIFNLRYTSNAWVYKYKSDGGSYGDIYSTPSDNPNYYDMAGYFPQAGTNFLLGLSLKL